MINRGAIRAVVGLMAVVATTAIADGCTSSGLGDTSGSPSTAVASGTPQYRVELESAGDLDRHDLVVPVPVGRTVGVTVSLRSQGEVVDIELRAAVLRSDADGGVQEVELRIVAVDADDPDTVAGLAPIVDAGSVLRRDGRLAVVEQVLDVPDGLAFRSDAVARQALRAPFSLIGPLPLQPVGVGAVWRVESTEGGELVSDREVTLVDIDADRYVLVFELPDGAVEIAGRQGSLLPDRQVITLADADLTVTATRTG